MIAPWLVVARAQGLVFPAVDDRASFSAVSYPDHGGSVDFGCGSATYDGHLGTDFGVGGFTGMDVGTTVTAAANGVVQATNDGEFDRCATADCPGAGGLGNFVQLLHPDGTTTLYAHLRQWSVAVAVGDPVVCGQVLGQVGSSGASNGPHLHFELRDDTEAALDPFDGPCSGPPGAWVDPGSYLELPGGECPRAAEPAPLGVVECGEVKAARSDDRGSTSAVWQYGCTDWTYSGPEVAYVLHPADDTRVTISLAGTAQDLDLFVLDGDLCAAGSVEPVGSTDVVGFDAVGGGEYLVVVDGWAGAASEFALEVACEGGPPPPPATGETGRVVDTGAAEPPPSGADPRPSAAEPGCGCAAPSGAGGAAVGLWLVGVGIGVRRRR